MSPCHRAHVPPDGEYSLCTQDVHILIDTMHAQRASSFHPVIATFACRATHRLWLGQRPPEFPATIQQTALRKLTQLQAASSLNDLRLPPGNRLKALQGNRRGQHSIRINDQYRICFHWVDREAYEIEITDYH